MDNGVCAISLNTQGNNIRDENHIELEWEIQACIIYK